MSIFFIQGWYSPALSGVSSAKIRDNAKQTKESCNRRLLRSDLSLTSHPEMEIDYYDYEVNNAGKRVFARALIYPISLVLFIAFIISRFKEM